MGQPNITKLITKTDFLGRVELSSSLSYDKLNPFIVLAQNCDLKPLLCPEFFYDIIKNYQQEEYQKLIHGETYSDEEGIERVFEGISPVLVHFTYARFIKTGYINNTPFGSVGKVVDHSEPITPEERETQNKEHRTIAFKYFNDVKQYLEIKYLEGKFQLFKNCLKSNCKDSTNNSVGASDVI